MKGLMTTVTNLTNGKSYFVSTVKSWRSEGLHETAVFRKILDRSRISANHKRFSLAMLRPIYTLA